MKGRILRAAQRAKQIETRVFTEKDMRGLTKAEKEFIRDNDYKGVISQFMNGRAQLLYMFIAKQRNGRKALYAITKRQSIRPNGRDFCPAGLNYWYWLTFDAKHTGFSSSFYECRFCDNMDIDQVIIHA